MQAGSLDRRVTLRRAVKAQDQLGQAIDTWNDLATVWASWRRASARETLASAEVSASVSDVFEIRWSEDVSSLSPIDLLVYEARSYDIVSVQEIGRREGLRIGAIARGE